MNPNTNRNVPNDTMLNNQYDENNNIINENLINNNQQNNINQFQINNVQNQNYQGDKDYQYLMNSNNSGNLNNENNNVNINNQGINENNFNNTTNNVRYYNQNKSKKSKGFWLGLFAAEIIIFIVLLSTMFGSIIDSNKNDTSRDGSTINEFITILRNNNYNISNLTNGNSSYVNNYYIAQNQYHSIEFIEYINDNYAYYKYLDTKEYIQSMEGNVTTNMSNSELEDYNRYEVTTNGITYIVARSNNTILYTATSSEYRDEANLIFTDLGYSGDINFNIFSFLLSFLFMNISICVLMIVVYWKIFNKAGENGWKSLIPVYNMYLMFKIAFGKGWYFILMFVPLVNFVIIFMLWYKLAKAFGKSDGFAVCSIFLSLFTLQIIAFDKSKYLLKNN